MRQNVSVILSLVFSAAFFGCNSFPKVSPCVYSSTMRGCYFSDDEGDGKYRADAEMDNNVCHTADEYQAIVEWAKRQKSKGGM